MKISNDDLLQTLQGQVLKREVQEGDEAMKAKKLLVSAARTKKKPAKKTIQDPESTPRAE